MPDFSSHFPILFKESEDHWDHDQLQAMACIEVEAIRIFFLADLAVANSWEQMKNHGDLFVYLIEYINNMETGVNSLSHEPRPGLETS